MRPAMTGITFSQRFVPKCGQTNYSTVVILSLLGSIDLRAHKQKQCITIALQFLVADACHRAELVVGLGTGGCDAFQGGIMENDVSRHAALSSHPCAPSAQGAQ